MRVPRVDYEDYFRRHIDDRVGCPRRVEDGLDILVCVERGACLCRRVSNATLQKWEGKGRTDAPVITGKSKSLKYHLIAMCLQCW